MSELYGPAILQFGSEPPDYELYVGLYLNKNRAIMRRALPLSMAGGIVFGGSIPPEWFDALTDNEAEANIAKKLAKKAEIKPSLEKLGLKIPEGMNVTIKE